MNVLSAWTEPAAVPTRPQPITRAADDAECAIVAEALGIPGCRSFKARYTITPLSRGRYLLSGELSVVLVQICVVTLDPFDQPLAVPFEIEFWPPDQIEPKSGHSAPGKEVEVDALSGEDPEPIVNGRLEIGPLLFQFLAAEIDLFPRGPEAELEQTEAGAPAADAAGSEHPFSALSRLKRHDDGSSSHD